MLLKSEQSLLGQQAHRPKFELPTDKQDEFDKSPHAIWTPAHSDGGPEGTRGRRPRSTTRPKAELIARRATPEGRAAQPRVISPGASMLSWSEQSLLGPGAH